VSCLLDLDAPAARYAPPASPAPSPDWWQQNQQQAALEEKHGLLDPWADYGPDD